MSVCADLYVEFSGRLPEQRLRQIQHHLLNVMQANSRNFFEFSPERLFLHPVAVKITDSGIEREDRQWYWQEEEESSLATSTVFQIGIGALRAYSEHYRHGPMMSYLTILMALLQQSEVVGVYLGSDEWHQLVRLREPEIIEKFKDFAAHGFEASTLGNNSENAPTCPFCVMPMHRTAYGGDKSDSGYTVPFTCSACGTSAQVIGAEALEFHAGRPYKVARYLDFARNIIFAGDAKTVLGKWKDGEEDRWWELQHALNLYENKVGLDGLYIALAEFLRMNHDALGMYPEGELKKSIDKLGKKANSVVDVEGCPDSSPSGFISKLTNALK